MNEETQASLLAKWLEEHPGQEPPRDLDPEVVEVLYALRPDLAPPPRVSLDDILDGVKSGPFVTRGVAEVETTIPLAVSAPPAAEEAANRPHGAPDAEALRRRRNRAIWGGIGSLAAAALVLLTLSPSVDQLKAPSPDAQVAPAAPPPPAPAAAEPRQVLEDYAPTQEKSGSAPGSAWDKLGLPSRSASKDEETVAPKTQAPAEVLAEAPAPEPAPAATPVPADNLPDAAASPAGGSSGASSYEYDEAVSLESASARKEKRTRAAPASAPSKSANVSDDYAPAAEAEEAPAKKSSSDLGSARASAQPGDYSSSWWRSSLSGDERSRFEETLGTAESLAKAGDPSGAAAACAVRISDPNVAIAQDMAWRAAKYAMQAGSNGTALSYVRQGQRRSGANTVYLAHLYALEGEILERQGDSEGALRAYQAAANLNAAR